MSDDRLFPIPIPALVVLLLRKEKEKGVALTEAEVCAVRDGAQCVMLTATEAARIADERGYPDLDPDRAWEQWNAIRPSLGL